MKAVELHHGSATDVGLVRQVNEDSYLATPPVFVVADGMGGHDGGDVASAIVVEEFAGLAARGYDPTHGPEEIAAVLERCQQRIEEYAAGQRAEGKQEFQSGTTAVIAMLVEEAGQPRWLLANLGDSRAYCYADGHLEQVSVDHSVVQELIDAGEITEEDAVRHPSRHIVTRALGSQAPPVADYFLLPLSAAERLVLCSDGVSGMVDPAELGRIAAEVPDPRDAADRMVAAALAGGGQDNATAVVVDVVGLVHESAYDSARRRVSLEQKLGALP